VILQRLANVHSPDEAEQNPDPKRLVDAFRALDGARGGDCACIFGTLTLFWTLFWIGLVD
jgi:hypothetical protein